jgi:hypothetical protein
MNTPPTLATIIYELTTLETAAVLPRARTARQLALAMNARANAPALAGAVRASHWLLMGAAAARRAQRSYVIEHSAPD